MRSALSAVSTRSKASWRLLARGFSQRTCLPASSAACHHVVRARRRSHQHRVAIDACQRLLQDSVARGGFYITTGVGVYDGGELDATSSCHHPGPAAAPDTESCLDYADDLRSSSDGPPASPFSSQAISSGVSATAPASTLVLNSSPVSQPTSAKISSG